MLMPALDFCRWPLLHAIKFDSIVPAALQLRGLKVAECISVVISVETCLTACYSWRHATSGIINASRKYDAFLKLLSRLRLNLTSLYIMWGEAWRVDFSRGPLLYVNFAAVFPNLQHLDARYSGNENIQIKAFNCEVFEPRCAWACEVWEPSVLAQYIMIYSSPALTSSGASTMLACKT